jgi:hypothetical protein
MIGNNKVVFINPEQAQRALAIAWQARVPINLIGSPGVGKTSAVEQFVARIRKTNPKFGYWPVTLAMKSVEDFGMPAPDKNAENKLRYLFPDDTPLSDPNAEGVVFLDEWDRQPDPAVQNAAMQLTLTGNFHGHKLSDKVFVVLAMNGTSDIYTSQTSEAARTRMVHLYMGTSSPGYWESWATWATNGGAVSENVAGFVLSRTDLMKTDAEFEELAECNPRTMGWLLSKLTSTMDASKIKSDDIKFALLAGAVTRGVALDYMAYEKIRNEMPSIDEILKNPATTGVPEKSGILFAVTMGLMRKLDNNGTAAKALVYIKRWPDEPGAFAANMIRKAKPGVVTLPEFSKWSNVNL